MCRHLEQERHDSRLARGQLRSQARTIQALQADCRRWQATAGKAAAAAAAAEYSRADASSEAARASHLTAEAAADADRLRRVQGELEAEVSRLRAEVQDAGEAVGEWERSAAEAEAAAAEEAEEWEREVEELREEVEKWRDAAAEAAEAARTAAVQQLQVEADLRRAQQQVRVVWRAVYACVHARCVRYTTRTYVYAVATGAA